MFFQAEIESPENFTLSPSNEIYDHIVVRYLYGSRADIVKGDAESSSRNQQRISRYVLILVIFRHGTECCGMSVAHI